MSNEITRSAATIAAEINAIKSQTSGILNAALTYAKRSCFEIGKRLEEAKALVPHGEWGQWLEVNFEYSESTAGNLMRIYREFGDEQINMLTGKSDIEVFEGLSQSQLVELFALPKDMRAGFVEERREELESGELSVKKLRDEIKQLKEEIERQDEAIRESDEQYDALLAKNKAIARDLELAEGQNKKLSDAFDKANQRAIDNAEQYGSMMEERDKLADELEELKAASEEAREVTVTVNEPTEEQIAEIRAAALAEAEEKHKNDIERLSSDLKEREEHYEAVLKEAREAADKKLRQLTARSDPHAARVSYCMEAIGRAMNDINAEVSAMEQENPGSGLKMRMRCESTLLGLLNRCGWQV